jgi:glycosyltransferase involved in cell wall biosynthesis
MNVIVVQIGARHHYAVPRMMEKAGCLSGLYTDSCANQGIGWWAKTLLPTYFQRSWIKGITQRTIAGVPHKKLFSTDKLLWEIVRQRFFPEGNMYLNQRRVGTEFSAELIKWGIQDANVVYSMFGEGYEFLEIAKKQGLKIAVDVFINPIAHRIYRQERALYPAWEDQFPEILDRQVEEHIKNLIDLANLLLCPSTAVIEGLRTYPNCDSNKIRLVPYGSGIHASDAIEASRQGRILFGGSAELRKGIQYYAKAAQILTDQGKDYEFIVAGTVTNRIKSQPECKFLRFLGRVPRPQMIDEFRQADVFVLPTLAEGSASVIYEALAFGLPVITTHSAGSVIENGIEGLIVPERDGEALAAAILTIVENRNLRDQMSKAARQAISKYSEDHWRERLVAVLRGVAN